MKYAMSWALGPAIVDENGNLRVVHVEKFYNPFDHYHAGGGERSLYLRFASLDASDVSAIKAFASEYGVLGLSEHKTRTATPDEREREHLRPVAPGILGGGLLKRNGRYEYDDMKDFGFEVQLMRLIIELWHLCLNANATDEQVHEATAKLIVATMGRPALGALQEMLALAVENEDTLLAQGLDVQGLWRDRVIGSLAKARAETHHTAKEWALKWIAFIVDFRLQGFVSFGLTREENGFAQNITAHTLLAALYMMLAMDLCGVFAAERCHDETCGQFFIPTRKDKIYCSEDCKNRQRLRNWRRERQSKAGARGTT